MKCSKDIPRKFCAAVKWPDGGVGIIEYFETKEDALAWISTQRKPKNNEFEWMIGEW